MKIGIDISQIVFGTGVSNYTKELVEYLLKIDHKNQYILFGSSLRSNRKPIEFKESLDKYKNVNFKITHFPPIFFEFFFNRFRVVPLEKFISEEIDVFHSSDWTQPKVKSQHTKKVTTVHDLTVYLFPSSSTQKIISTQKKRLELVKKEADLVIVDSETTKDDLVKFVDIPQEKIRVIPLGVSEKFKPQDDDKINEVTQKYKIKKPYILSVATQEPRKNIQKLVDSYEIIHQKYPKLTLVLTGKQGWGPGFRFGENVIWTNYVPQEDLTALYSVCRVFVYPSLYEGFGLPVLEAMACGAPIVTSNNSSLAEIAKDAAILIDPRSENQLVRSIEMVINLNLENYQKMVRASLERARKYTWKKCAQETLKVYE